MKLIAALNRTLVTIHAVGPQPIVGHPLSALAFIGIRDRGLTDLPTIIQTYADLVSLGLPTGYNVLSVAGSPFDGFGFVGPDGLIPFKVERVIHRIGFGAAVGDGFVPLDLLSNTIMNVDSGYKSNYPLNVSACSMYHPSTFIGASIIALENNSFNTINGTFTNVPGVVTSERKMRGLFNIGSNLLTFVETIPPLNHTNGPVIMEWGGRALGFDAPPYKYDVVEAKYLGLPIYTSAQFLSQYVVDIDDSRLSNILSLAGKVYLISCNAARINNIGCNYDAATAQYYGIGANQSGSLGPNVNSLVIDITSLAGSTIVSGVTLDAGVLSDQNGNPLGASYSGMFGIGASVNLGLNDIVFGDVI